MVHSEKVNIMALAFLGLMLFRPFLWGGTKARPNDLTLKIKARKLHAGSVSLRISFFSQVVNNFLFLFLSCFTYYFGLHFTLCIFHGFIYKKNNYLQFQFLKGFRKTKIFLKCYTV